MITSPFEQEKKRLQAQRMKEIHTAKEVSPPNSQPSSEPPSKTSQVSRPSAPTVVAGNETSDDGSTIPSGTVVLPQRTAPIVPSATPPPTSDDDVPKLSPPSNTETTTSKMDLDKIIDVPNGPRLGAQIKLDVGRISGQVTDSGLRSLIGGYQRVVSPHFEMDEDAHFPRSHKPHATFAHRSSMDGFGNVLLFHIGAAILAYYKICRKTATGRDMVAIDRVHRMAERGATSFKAMGTDFKGYSLEPMVDMR